jgi:hypothetical protein
MATANDAGPKPTHIRSYGSFSPVSPLVRVKSLVSCLPPVTEPFLFGTLELLSYPSVAPPPWYPFGVLFVMPMGFYSDVYYQEGVFE